LNDGKELKFACSYPKLQISVNTGAKILVADGDLELKVSKILKDGVLAIA